MCGIVGVVNKGNERLEIKKFLEKISHRGLIQNETLDLLHISVGANRLPIVDEAKAAQPLYNEDKTVFVVQNGEIFNHKDLQMRLRQKGHSFLTESDTEVLVHLWEEYGPSMIRHLDSEMFAFILYDTNSSTIFVGRDRLGVKPLYYAETEQHVLFASEIKALAWLDDVEKIEEFPPGHYYLNGKFVK